MQHALVHLADGTYTEFIARGSYQYDINQYASLRNLCDNTEYSSGLIQSLNATYTHWVLIFSEEGALLVGYNVNGCTLVCGEIATIVDWVRDVTIRAPHGPVESGDCKTVDNLFEDPSVGPLLNYLYDLNYIPPLSGYEELHLNQTNNGTFYWRCLLPPEYLQ